MDEVNIVLNAAVRLSIPLIFAGIGEWIAERAGTLNLSIEGMMLGGAFTSILVFPTVDNSPLAFLAGAAAGAVVGWVHGELSHRLVANTFVVGITLTIFTVGFTSFLNSEFSFAGQRIVRTAVPLLSDIPILGPAFFDKPWPAYLLWVVIPGAYWLVYRARWGLEARAAGEDPSSAELAGIDVNRRRRQSLLLCGALAGAGGAYLSIGEVGIFSQLMTGGRGFVVLAAVIFGGWRLGLTIVGCLLFGLADSVRLALPAFGIQVSTELLQMAPYLLALLVLTIFVGRGRRPSALAKPFIGTK